MRFAKSLVWMLGFVLTLAPAVRASAADDGVTVRSGLAYAEHDGVKLVGLYICPNNVPAYRYWSRSTAVVGKPATVVFIKTGDHCSPAMAMGFFPSNIG
jgi:hypothetical protein